MKWGAIAPPKSHRLSPPTIRSLPPSKGPLAGGGYRPSLRCTPFWGVASLGGLALPAVRSSLQFYYIPNFICNLACYCIAQSKTYSDPIWSVSAPLNWLCCKSFQNWLCSKFRAKARGAYSFPLYSTALNVCFFASYKVRMFQLKEK